MEINNTLNPNCSELVVRLYPVDSEKEFIDLIEQLEEITGWKLGISVWCEGIKNPKNNVDMVKKRLKQESDEFYITKPIDHDIIKFDEDLSPIVHFKDIKKDPRLSWVQRKYTSFEVIPGLIPYDDLRINKDSIDPLDITMFDGYCDVKGPYAEASQHCYTSHFEPMIKIIEELDTDIHSHDGGSTHEIEQWMINNGYDHLINKIGGGKW